MYNVYVVICIIEKHLLNNKKIYCCFVDYRKAFDSVNRNFLFKKLIKLGTRRNMFQSIFSLYKNVKICVKYENNFSEFFNVKQGVLQGKALSPLLFSFYWNDFENSYILLNCEDTMLQENRCF